MNKATLDIEGVIGWEVTARQVKRDLKDMGEVDEIDVYINSPGGYIDDGFGTFTALKNHPAKINMHITGMAASMGSVIAMAGDRVTIEPTGMMMIHPPASIAWGTAEEMRKEADVLDKYESRIITAYKRRDLKLNDAELDEAVANETWYTAQEALDAGFVDAISDGDEPVDEPTNSSLERLRVARYKNTPPDLAEKIQASGEKARNLGLKLTNGSSSAANKPTGTNMKKYDQAELDAAVTAAADAATTKANAEHSSAVAEAVSAAEAGVHARYDALFAHKNGGNIAAVQKRAKSGLTIDEAVEFMDDVAAPEAATAPAQPLLSDAELTAIKDKAAADAIAQARLQASGTAGLESDTGLGLDAAPSDSDAPTADEIKQAAADARAAIEGGR